SLINPAKPAGDQTATALLHQSKGHDLLTFDHHGAPTNSMSYGMISTTPLGAAMPHGMVRHAAVPA
ncbi:hypothetical protein, partial [Paramagnetospirillum marisnigri]|uniref:hypothetical protein n=1 Tax=Paramagnetospirillum marisnigri TaxID=1285242 RepID=UPI001C12A6B8